MIRMLAAVLFVSAVAAVFVARATTAPALGLHLFPCAQGKAKFKAQCGTFGVYEDRTSRRGRIIALRVIVMPAVHPSHRAIAEIAGGPGESASDFAPALADGAFGKARLALRDRYDYLFVDDRGVGQSHPFVCDFAPRGDPAVYFRSLWPPQIVRRCKERSSATHDRRLYNTNNAVDDLDDVRAALRYPRIVLDGGSYGTFFSLVYLRRHPQHVESAVLDAVTAPHFQPLPGSPEGAQRALSDLFAKCRADARCHANFPLFEEHFYAVLRRFDRGPIAVPVRNLVTKRVQTVALSKEVFVDQLRHVFYDAGVSAYVPYVVERAYRSDYAPLAQVVQTATQAFSGALNMAANLSYTCADWMPFVTPAQMTFARTHSFAGDLRILAQQQACLQWDVPAMPAAFNDPVRSDAPILMILGSDDPATPPQYGLDALRHLPNGRAVLVTGGGHGADTPCTDKLILRFVRARSARGLDVRACSASFKLPPFATSMKGWPT